MTSPAAAVPRSGPCSPWVQGDAVESLPWVAEAAAKLAQSGKVPPQGVEAICAEAAAAASEALYALSARQFTGSCGPITVRPVVRPPDLDTRAWAGMLTAAWNTAGGLGSSYGGALPGIASHYGKPTPPELDLIVYPVTEILQVKIDGEVIPEDEYELRDFRKLIRLRTSGSAEPVARFGWPTTQTHDLPDTEPGTFSVTFRFGQPPPALGVIAATKLAEYLALPRLGDSRHYPQRVTSMNRQGVSSMVVDVMDVLKAKALGIWEVDVFLLTYNPQGRRRRSRIFSPDIGKARRVATPTYTGGE